MPTFTIVGKDKDPLGPNEINAGDTIQVEDGDVFIFDPSADANTTFESASGTATDFDIEFNDSNANKFEVKAQENLTPSILIGDGADLSDVKFDMDKADGANLTAGDGVSIGEYKGTKDGDDDLWIGDDFTAKKIETKGGDDSITIGDRASIKEVDSGKDDDTIIIGDDFSGKKLKAGEGDDTIKLGANADLDNVDGGKGDDTLNTQSPDIKDNNFEETNIVCFAQGTMIRTPAGDRAIEDLAIGDLVITMDNGPRPIGWIGARSLSEADLRRNPKLRPIRLKKNALGDGVPDADLVVSPQHRILFQSKIADRMFGSPEVLVAARQMLGLPSVEIAETDDGVRYFHLLFDAHELVFSNNAPTESLFTGPEAMRGLGADARDEIAALFPTLLNVDAERDAARPFPDNGRKARKLVERHVANDCPVVQ